MAKPAAELIRHLFDYNPETGVFRWKNNPAGMQKGSRAGCFDVDSSGYKRRRIRVLGKLYRASDLAWLYMTGEWPVLSVDHANRNGADDRWDNLRLATRSQQMMNRGDWNAAYFRGVTKSGNKFMARIQVDKKSIYLGTYVTVLEAKHAYDEAAKLHHGTFRGVM